MTREFKFPRWACDPHLQDLQDLQDSGAWHDELNERVQEIELHERAICDWCEQKGVKK